MREESERLTVQDLDGFFQKEELDKLEAHAQVLVDDTVKEVATEESLRSLATNWTTQAATHKHSVDCLLPMLDKTFTREHEAVVEILGEWSKYKYLTRAVELLGIPVEDDDSLLARKPDETPYEYIKRIKHFR